MVVRRVGMVLMRMVEVRVVEVRVVAVRPVAVRAVTVRSSSALKLTPRHRARGVVRAALSQMKLAT